MYWAFIYVSIYSYWVCFYFCCYFLIDILAGIASSTVRIEICKINAILKKYQSKIKNKKKKHDEIVLLAKTKINSVEVLISKALTNSYINHNEFVLVNNVLKKYNNMKRFKDLNNSSRILVYL